MADFTVTLYSAADAQELARSVTSIASAAAASTGTRIVLFVQFMPRPFARRRFAPRPFARKLPPVVKMVHRPDAVADFEPVGCRDGSAHIGLGRLGRLSESKPLGETGGDG